MDDNKYFQFDLNCTTHVVPLATARVYTPGWVRKHRRLDEVDYFNTLLENLCGFDPDNPPDATDEERLQGQQIIDALDAASWPDHKNVQSQLVKHLNASLGE